MKIFLRTLVYQFLLLFVGVAIGFIGNAEYIGWKSAIIERSIQNIFFPIEYDENVERYVLETGRMRLYTTINGNPYNNSGVKVLDEMVWGEEFYICLYEHTPAEGKPVVEEYSTRIRWKPWEYYYEYQPLENDEPPLPPGTPIK